MASECRADRSGVPGSSSDRASAARAAILTRAPTKKTPAWFGLMLLVQLQALPNACTTQRFLARPTAWFVPVRCNQLLGGLHRASGCSGTVRRTRWEARARADENPASQAGRPRSPTGSHPVAPWHRSVVPAVSGCPAARATVPVRLMRRSRHGHPPKKCVAGSA